MDLQRTLKLHNMNIYKYDKNESLIFARWCCNKSLYAKLLRLLMISKFRFINKINFGEIAVSAIADRLTIL